MKTVAIVVLAAICSCKQAPQKVAVARQSAMAEQIRFELSVYIPPGKAPGRANHRALLTDLLATQYRNIKLVEALPDRPETMLVRAQFNNNVSETYAPPDERRLQYVSRGLTSDQKKALARTKDALILQFAHPRSQAWIALKTESELIEDLARKTNGFVWDESTREIFTPERWHQIRLAPDLWNSSTPDISSQITIHIYSTGEYVREITLGMEKMGLPDIVAQELPQGSSGSMAGLINLFCQALGETDYFETNGTFRLDIQTIKNTRARTVQLKSMKANGLGHGCVTLKPGRWEDGDPRNRLIDLSGERYSGPDSQAKQENMASSLFGWEDKVHIVKHDTDVLVESQKERAKLPALRSAFDAGLEAGEYIELKAPFPTPDGGTEWMWVEVTKWKDQQITGILANSPDMIPSLHMGQVVNVRETDIFDYIRHYPDKHVEGNTTEAILMRLDQQEQPQSSIRQRPEDPDCATPVH